jgi:hypothetical protein
VDDESGTTDFSITVMTSWRLRLVNSSGDAHWRFFQGSENVLHGIPRHSDSRLRRLKRIARKPAHITQRFGNARIVLLVEILADGPKAAGQTAENEQDP